MYISSITIVFTSNNFFLILAFILSLKHVTFLFGLISSAECIVIPPVFTAVILLDPNIKAQSFFRSFFHDTRTL